MISRTDLLQRVFAIFVGRCFVFCFLDEIYFHDSATTASLSSSRGIVTAKRLFLASSSNNKMKSEVEGNETEAQQLAEIPASSGTLNAIWLGSPVPDIYRRALERGREIHDGYTLRLWVDSRHLSPTEFEELQEWSTNLKPEPLELRDFKDHVSTRTPRRRRDVRGEAEGAAVVQDDVDFPFHVQEIERFFPNDGSTDELWQLFVEEAGRDEQAFFSELQSEMKVGFPSPSPDESVEFSFFELAETIQNRDREMFDTEIFPPNFVKKLRVWHMVERADFLRSDPEICGRVGNTQNVYIDLDSLQFSTETHVALPRPEQWAELWERTAGARRQLLAPARRGSASSSASSVVNRPSWPEGSIFVDHEARSSWSNSLMVIPDPRFHAQFFAEMREGFAAYKREQETAVGTGTLGKLSLYKGKEMGLSITEKALQKLLRVRDSEFNEKIMLASYVPAWRKYNHGKTRHATYDEPDGGSAKLELAAQQDDRYSDH